MAQQRCPYCGCFFSPDCHAGVQKCCGEVDCRRARKRGNLRHWRSLHPESGDRYAAKERAWAKAYPDYWRSYRRNNPEYVARDNQRRVESRKRARRSANETGLRQVVVEKVRIMESAMRVEVSANETGLLRRMSAVEECLRSTAAMALSAR